MNAMDNAMNEAAEWFLKIRRTEPSPEELKQWNVWLRVEGNQQAFDAVTRAWRSAEGLSEDTPWPAADVLDETRPRRRSWALAAAAALAVVSVGLFAWFNGAMAPFGSGPLEVYETVAGQHRELELPDGSKMHLGARTSVSVSYSAERRIVVLDRGEALFEVARDVQRPFVVLAGGGTITAVGTAFNVKRSDTGVVVTVTEGKVEVAQRRAESPRSAQRSVVRAQLEQGEQVSYSMVGNLGEVRRMDPQVAVAWREGRLLYRDERLEQVVADVNRYSRKHIVFGDRAAGELLFSGTVQQDEVEEWLLGLEDIFPLRVTQTDGDHVLLHSR
jgi:transmembrane sensor